MLLTALDIKTALNEHVDRLAKLQKQIAEYKDSAHANRSVFNEHFYIKSGKFGWSKNTLVEADHWYHELNIHNKFEPCCIKHDGSKVWFKAYVTKFVEGNYASMDDVVEETHCYDADATGLVGIKVLFFTFTCIHVAYIFYAVDAIKRCFLLHERKKKQHGKRHLIMKKEFFKKCCKKKRVGTKVI